MGPRWGGVRRGESLGGDWRFQSGKGRPYPEERGETLRGAPLLREAAEGRPRACGGWGGGAWAGRAGPRALCGERSVLGGAAEAGEGARALRSSAPHRFPARGRGGCGGRRGMRDRKSVV